MPLYTDDDHDDLVDAAMNANPRQQREGLARVAGILEQSAIAYGVMGGMNFYLRGSGRTTGDIDLAVDNPPRMETLLRIFDDKPESVPDGPLFLALCLS